MGISSREEYKIKWKVVKLIPEAYSGPSQTTEMKRFAKIVNS